MGDIYNIGLMTYESLSQKVSHTHTKCEHCKKKIGSLNSKKERKILMWGIVYKRGDQSHSCLFHSV